MKLDFLSAGAGGHGAHRFDLFTPASSGPPPLDDARHIIRVGLITIALFFGVLLLLALVLPISGAATAPGEIVTSGTTIVVQPENGGVVGGVFVREGQHVRAGQPLVRLNGVRSAAAAEQAQAKHDALRALEARLIAERDNATDIVFPADLITRIGDQNVASAIAAQSAIFSRHREILGADRAIAATDTDVAEAQRTGTDKQLQSIREELKTMRLLFSKGYARLSQVRSLERAEADIEMQRATAGSSITKSNFERVKLGDQQVMDVVGQLGQVQEQLAQVNPALRVTRYDADKDMLRAQVDGRVSGLAAIGPGMVLGAGKTVMEIVPDRRALIVQAEVKPADIDDVRVGQPATLRFPSVNARGQSAFEGKVVALSPNRIAGPDGQNVYRAQIMVTDPAKLARNDIRLQPGQPVTVQIRTHARTLFGYLFGPLEEAATSAFREE